MKTILERAKEAVIDPFDPDEMLPVRMGYLSMLERRGFVAGAMSELYFLVIPQRDCVAKLLNSPDCMGYALRFQPLLSLNVQPCHVLRFFRGVRENPN